MEKIIEALKKLLPEKEVSEVSKAVKSMLSESEKTIRSEYEAKLNEAYEKFTADLKKAEETGELGYQQAYEVIAGLQRRLEEQAEAYENQMEEGFEEAFQELQAEKAKNEKIEIELYEEFDKKLREMKEFMVDKVDQFLSFQEAEIYEHAKRDVLSDPRLLEHKVALDRIVSIVSENVSDEDMSVAASKKLEEAHKAIEDLKGQMRVIESRNVRLSMQNNALVEQVRKAEAKLTESVNESVKLERKERASKKENVSGRGKKVIREQDELLSEYNNPAVAQPKQDQTISESADPLNDLLVLSGI
jgi:hypothetical protein